MGNVEAHEIAQLVQLYMETKEDELLLKLFDALKGIYVNAYHKYYHQLKLVDEKEAQSIALECLYAVLPRFNYDVERSPNQIGKQFCALYRCSLLNIFCNMSRYDHAQKRSGQTVSYEEWMGQESDDGGIGALIDRLCMEECSNHLTIDEYHLLHSRLHGYSLKEWGYNHQYSYYKSSRMMEKIRCCIHQQKIFHDHYQPKA